MNEPFLSVIIPTYNRQEILGECLNAIFHQTFHPFEYEIIVINDGSTDGTERLIQSMASNFPGRLQYLKQENKGPAIARNKGIEKARGRIILFMGDDIIATPTLLEEHSQWHREYPEDNIAILGYITWSPEIIQTPFMKWLETSGVQFGYHLIRNPHQVPYNFFAASNTSLKKQFLIKEGLFDEDFPYAALEDTELSYRLDKQGMLLKYNKEAIAYHHHLTSLQEAGQRMIKIGKSSLIFAEKTGVNLIPLLPPRTLLREALSKFKFAVYYTLARYYEKREIKENIFSYVMEYYQHIGARN